jgi:Protein of unknown function (DUF1207)/HsdM N-terminal domain
MPGARLRKYGATDAHQPDTTAANVGYKARLWQMADALRGSRDVAEYKHVVLGLIFLKYEFRSPWRADFGAMRPIGAADFKNFEEHNWSTDISARAGVQFDSLQVLDRNLQILVEYFNGHSPSGQFYRDKIEYIGLGAHFHFERSWE